MSSGETAVTLSETVGSGIEGLDNVLVGGYRRNRLYLVEGQPGTGKTTLALQFLIDGARNGEKCLYITLAETEDELRTGAASHGWDLDGIDVFELLPPESLLDEKQQQSLLYSSDLELGETTRSIIEAIERTKPLRVVFDSLSEIRLLAQSSLRYRRQLLALKHYFSRHGASVLFLDDLTADPSERTAHSIAHGVLQLEEVAPEYGAERRRLRVVKCRGQAFRGGFHDVVLAHGGLRVFPRLVAAEHHRNFGRDQLQSGIVELDALLGGGLERGSSALILGPSGIGKSLLTLQFLKQAVSRGERAAMFAFDEDIGLLTARAAHLGIDLKAMRDSGALMLVQVDAAELSPGEFAHTVRTCIEKHHALTVVIDSLNGYHMAMPDERFLLLHMHELLMYLNRRGVSTFLTVAQHGVVGDMRSPFDVTYLSDAVLLLRYFESRGRMLRALSVIKKRTGSHEDTIREFRITESGFQLGSPLTEFEGVMSGVPIYTGTSDPRTHLSNE
ncbi:ATPase domain-containing protein [Acidisphaera rubrifaciens]|uniref:non-specific serine/threonine protein kinase n=1 Tax=Acidisphaera rubrifaciens HS-AP3 TaxID=1231350 RepID=A0A0D6P719_9PROT|nr:ATPase domain-containing protein [Acidisphaera rubrifaciens]GAN77111.1 circadian clock protein KaiC [Acidisphaera rubrifaciens HS-AP3]